MALWRQERLGFILERAATRVPFYRRQWEERRRHGDKSPWDRLENWPILAKDSVREDPRSFVAEDCDVRRMYHEHTSGTTGKPLHLWQSRDTVRRWFALFDARLRGWNGVARSDRWAMIGGQLVVPVSRAKPPFWVRNLPMRQLYLSSYHLSPRNVAAYLRAMERFGVVYMLGYASSMVALAQSAQEQGLAAPRLKVAISNAEPLSPSQRERIGQVFGCPVRDTYGMAEIACGASECSAGTMHIWPDAGFIEVLRDDEDYPAATGESGRLICTGLINADMPLIRYAVGDRGALAAAGPRCNCGRDLPRLDRIEGRLDDVLVTAEGRLVGRLDPVFKADLPIREAQIIQESRHRVRVKIVPAAGLEEKHLRLVQRRLQDRLGSSLEVVMETVTERYQRGLNRKFRSVTSLSARSSGRRQTPGRHRGTTGACVSPLSDSKSSEDRKILCRQANGASGPLPFVSVLMPVRNESRDIARNLTEVLAQDYPAERLEILVADGRSTDGTREILEGLAAVNPRLRIIENPGRIVSSGLNRALEQARGEVIVRLDGHGNYPHDYVRRVVALRSETGASNAGGVLVPVGTTYVQRSICAALSAPVGVGGAAMRSRAPGDDVRDVDAVNGGCWLRETLTSAGGFSEEMVRNQDDELSFRLRKAGGRVVQSSSIRFQYVVRDRWRKLFQQYLQYGYWKVRVVQKYPTQASARHVAPALLVGALLGGTLAAPFSRLIAFSTLALGIAYLAAVTVAGFAAAQRRRALRLWPGASLALLLMQVGYGWGSVLGLVGLLVGRSRMDPWFSRLSR